MEKEKIIIEPLIAGKKMPLRIEKEQEAAHIKANELLNKRYAVYEEIHKDTPREYILAMTAYSLAYQVIDLQNALEASANNRIVFPEIKNVRKKKS